MRQKPTQMQRQAQGAQGQGQMQLQGVGPALGPGLLGDYAAAPAADEVAL